MIVRQTQLPDVVLIDLDPVSDERGFFGRVFCEDDFACLGLPVRFVQSSLSFNRFCGTLRGLHYAANPAQEGKLVQCTRGAIFDVIVDIRHSSAAFGRWETFELTVQNRRMLYIPPGFAHGFQTLADETDVLYSMTEPYQPGLARGIRWNDASLGIPWPRLNPILSERDAALPGLDTAMAQG
ncbi:MAG: dTDP-4-dehydrorhamnose 3,5-epimerase [Rhodospirillales bacterium]|nr:dTDP-4-dehydrorhamnose 3,5-epimerase [Rhodospirillales bacterium]MDE2318512.1 dTDP-4-dehydrorhamnose 3,5-epimerase [Rhodospirillales bacterium]